MSGLSPNPCEASNFAPGCSRLTEQLSFVMVCVSGRSMRPCSAAAGQSVDHLRGGRLLVYFPDFELAEVAAEAETDGFVDLVRGRNLVEGRISPTAGEAPAVTVFR